MIFNFKRLTDHTPIEVIPYIREYLVQKPETKIYIGCDSQNYDITKYAVVIVLHNPSRGGHVLYCKWSVPLIKDILVKLWMETKVSVDIADLLTKNGLPKPEHIDLDYNPDPKYKSNAILLSALGYVQSMGYSPRCKPNAIIASNVADSLL